jgi:integrase/recombinase XerC
MQKKPSANSARALTASTRSTIGAADKSANSADAHESTISADGRAALDLLKSALEARGAAETTRRYLVACETLARARAGAPLHETSWRDAQTVLASLHARGLAPRTLATTLSAWKTWFRILARHDARFHPDALDAVRVPKPPKRLPSALSETEMTQLLALAPLADASDEPMWRVRDQAMFELLYGCGLRVGELVGVNLEHIDASGGEIRVYGKGRKERALPLGVKARDALNAWLHVRHECVGRLRVADAHTAVFIGSRGGRIAATTVRRALAQTAIQQGITSHVHPHRLRHSFASHVLQSSRDLRAVQELMGHASIASTQVYTHLDFQHLAAVYDGAHPRARKKKPT